MRPLLSFASRSCGALLIACLLATTPLVGCADKPTEADCKALLDHMIDLEIKAAGTDNLTPEMKKDLEKQRKEVKDYVRKEAIDKCMTNLPTSVVKCGLKAKTLEERAACDKR